MTETVRLTVAQALVRFLANQHSERDGVEQRLVTGMFGIFKSIIKGSCIIHKRNRAIGFSTVITGRTIEYIQPEPVFIAIHPDQNQLTTGYGIFIFDCCCFDGG